MRILPVSPSKGMNISGSSVKEATSTLFFIGRLMSLHKAVVTTAWLMEVGSMHQKHRKFTFGRTQSLQLLGTDVRDIRQVQWTPTAIPVDARWAMLASSSTSTPPSTGVCCLECTLRLMVNFLPACTLCRWDQPKQLNPLFHDLIGGKIGSNIRFLFRGCWCILVAALERRLQSLL